jgi:hypothetical protein
LGEHEGVTPRGIEPGVSCNAEHPSTNVVVDGRNTNHVQAQSPYIALNQPQETLEGDMNTVADCKSSFDQMIHWSTVTRCAGNDPQA